jgi:hypothetical protein
MSFDTVIENRTPFDVQSHVQVTAEGQERLVLMLSASFTADASGKVGLAEVQQPVTFADEPWGDPALSSVRYEADIAPKKVLPEVIVNATAHAPGGRPAEAVTVGLQIGEVRKVLQVTGDRVHHLGGFSDPAPFLTMPLMWDRRPRRAQSGRDRFWRCAVRRSRRPQRRAEHHPPGPGGGRAR